MRDPSQPYSMPRRNRIIIRSKLSKKGYYTVILITKDGAEDKEVDEDGLKKIQDQLDTTYADYAQDIWL